MKRYKDCKIISSEGLSISQILEVVEQSARVKSYKTERNSCLRIDDTVMVFLGNQSCHILESSCQAHNEKILCML